VSRGNGADTAVSDAAQRNDYSCGYNRRAVLLVFAGTDKKSRGNSDDQQYDRRNKKCKHYFSSLFTFLLDTSILPPVSHYVKDFLMNCF
jgi:hypothetical protein